MTRTRSDRHRRDVSPGEVRQFKEMIPEIRHHSELALRGRSEPQIEGGVVLAVAGAFDVFTRLAERGLSELAYPQPLAMAALAGLDKNHREHSDQPLSRRREPVSRG